MQDPLDRIAERRLEAVTLRRMQDEPAILLQGPRTVGKSTLLRRLAETTGRDVLDLDDLDTREAVRADPQLFVRSDSPVLIDEFQHVPEILDAIKAELNVDPRPGRFLLTGSSRYSALPTAAQALTGRLHRLDVRPLSQGEIDGIHEDFAAVLIDDPRRLVSSTIAPMERKEIVRRVVAGGFPMALRRPDPASRARWFDDYLDLVIERDVLELSRVKQRRQLPRLLRQLASQTGQPMNIANAASAISLDSSTAENYTKLLEAVFLISRLPAWGTTLGSRVAASPKIHVGDTGLAAHLLRLSEEKLGAATPQAFTEFGHVLETFVVGEVSKQLDWLDEPVARGHWRTHDRDEVDLIAERRDGKVAALEVKAASRVSARDLRSLQALERKLGDAFLGGVVCYTGRRAHSYSERIHIIPVHRVWQREP